MKEDLLQKLRNLEVDIDRLEDLKKELKCTVGFDLSLIQVDRMFQGDPSINRVMITDRTIDIDRLKEFILSELDRNAEGLKQEYDSYEIVRKQLK